MKQIDGVCPRCGKVSLNEKILPGGGKVHECDQWSCAYFMIWKPTEKERP